MLGQEPSASFPIGGMIVSRLGIAISCAITALLLSGCADVKAEFFLNPDGSAKVAFEYTVDVDQLVKGKANKADEPGIEVTKARLQEIARESVRDIIDEDFVTAWRSLSVEVKDKKITVRGTAYLQSMDAVDLDLFIFDKWPVAFRKGTDGKMTLTIPLETNSGDKSKPSLTAEDMQGEIEQFQEMANGAFSQRWRRR